MSNLLNIKDQNGNWIPIPVITNGIQSITQNQDYTLTITLNDGTTYTTTSIKGEDGQDYILTENDKQEIADLIDVPVEDVQINGTSIVSNGVAEIPIATTDVPGIVKVPVYTNGYRGGMATINGTLYTIGANITDIKLGTDLTKPLSAANSNTVTFYGLAKASGDTTQSQSNNEVGTYTDEAKVSIKTMIGVEDPVVDDVQVNGASVVANGVANISLGNNSQFGVVKGNTAYGINIANGEVRISSADSNLVKVGSTASKPLTPNTQHEATFYGLAKASGSDEKDSTLPVGQYTESAKTAIKQMLDIKDDYDSLVVEVSGTDPVITGKPSYRYNCGELYTLTITPPTSGTMDIIFASGATPTILSLPNTVKMPDWWAGIETNTTYEMCITDGTYCGVMSWVT